MATVFRSSPGDGADSSTSFHFTLNQDARDFEAQLMRLTPSQRDSIRSFRLATEGSSQGATDIVDAEIVPTIIIPSFRNARVISLTGNVVTITETGNALGDSSWPEQLGNNDNVQTFSFIDVKTESTPTNIFESLSSNFIIRYLSAELRAFQRRAIKGTGTGMGKSASFKGTKKTMMGKPLKRV